MANPILIASIADKMLGVIEKFLDPKQYDIVRMKRMSKAINWAEKEFDLMNDFIYFVKERTEMFIDEKEFKEFENLHKKNKRYFDKYD